MSPRWLRLVRPLLLLFVCIATLRSLPLWVRPADRGIDCIHRGLDRATLEQCVALHPNDVELLTELAGDYARTSSWAQAEATYRKALSIDPLEGDLHVRLGDVLLARGDMSAARREAMTAAGLQPGRAAPRDLLRRSESNGANGDAGR